MINPVCSMSTLGASKYLRSSNAPKMVASTPESSNGRRIPITSKPVAANPLDSSANADMVTFSL